MTVEKLTISSHSPADHGGEAHDFDSSTQRHELALYGSDEWWAAIGDGQISKREIQGVISRLMMTGHGDWPEFELDSDGVKTRWTRLGKRALYAEGKQAKIEYVFQKPRKDRLGKGKQKQALLILIRRG